MNIQQIVKIVATIIVVLVLWKLISGIIVGITVPLIVLLINIFKVLLIIAAIVFIARVLGIGTKK